MLRDIRMVLLQRTNTSLSLLVGGNAFGSGNGRSQGGDIRDLKFYGCFANIRVVIDAEFAARGIDDQLNFPVLDSVHNVGASLMHLKNMLGLNAMFCQEPMGPVGRLDLKAKPVKLLGHFQDRRSIPLRDGDKNRSSRGECLLGSLFRFIKGKSEGAGHAQYLSGGAHLRAEKGVHFGEHVEREDSLLDAVVSEGPG